MGQDEQQNESTETGATEDREERVDRERDEQIIRLDSFLNTLAPGASILIERIKPSWCSGILEELEISEDGIDLEYLIDTWGGELLSIKLRSKTGRFVGGSYKVPLYSYPPLRWGKSLRKHDKGGQFEDDERSAPAAPPSPIVVNNPASIEKLFALIPAVIPMVTKIMENSEARRQSDMAMMMQLMKSNQTGGITDITKIGAVMTQLNEMFRSSNMGNVDQSAGEMDFMAQAMDVLKMFMDKPKSQQITPSPSPSRLSNRQVSPTPAPAPAPSVTHLNPKRDLARTISDMDPTQAAQTIIEALGYMPPDKQEAAMKSFISEYQNFEDGDFEDDGADEDTEQRGVK